MRNSDVEGIGVVGKGVLVNTKPSSKYLEAKQKAIDEQRQRDKINTLEQEVHQIKDILALILQKVS